MRRHLQTERALRAGRLDELPEALVTQAGFPNVDEPYTGTPLMALAISWAPATTVADLISAGGDVNFEALDGFPALLGMVMSGREDRLELVRVLTEAGADLERRGINGWTALHAAASQNDADLVRVLLELGASPEARTGVDDDATPLEEAERVGAMHAARLLRD